ncbi:hypothetical protein EV182_002405, partial [Spiromyces aspiralis]
ADRDDDDTEGFGEDHSWTSDTDQTHIGTYVEHLRALPARESDDNYSDSDGISIDTVSSGICRARTGPAPKRVSAGSRRLACSHTSNCRCRCNEPREGNRAERSIRRGRHELSPRYYSSASAAATASAADVKDDDGDGSDSSSSRHKGIVERSQPLPCKQEQALGEELADLYEKTLFPSAESIESKREYVEKLSQILSAEFPGQDIETHIFGSSVNGLGTSSSDVDICLTTPSGTSCAADILDLNRVLRKHGMRTYCVPSARVPIVKAWDPALRIASDININNTVALYNTRMIQTFVAIDARVRPFVMTIKHWAKCRQINDAAFGGMLAPYAWVNLALNFLQMRDPPILPVLHPSKPTIVPQEEIHSGQVDVSFNDNIDALRGFGSANTESVAGLVYEFFRVYAYEFDYGSLVVSLRRGCYLTKRSKGWDVGRPARIFCIEEPFSTWLNLGHSASACAVREIRSEFRRAYRLLRDNNSFEAVCEPYERTSRRYHSGRSSRHSTAQSSPDPDKCNDQELPFFALLPRSERGRGSAAGQGCGNGSQRRRNYCSNDSRGKQQHSSGGSSKNSNCRTAPYETAPAPTANDGQQMGAETNRPRTHHNHHDELCRKRVASRGDGEARSTGASRAELSDNWRKSALHAEPSAATAAASGKGKSSQPPAKAATSIVRTSPLPEAMLSPPPSAGVLTTVAEARQQSYVVPVATPVSPSAAVGQDYGLHPDAPSLCYSSYAASSTLTSAASVAAETIGSSTNASLEPPRYRPACRQEAVPRGADGTAKAPEAKKALRLDTQILCRRTSSRLNSKVRSVNPVFAAL